MTLAVNPLSLIRTLPESTNPLDRAVQTAATNLAAMVMTRLTSIAVPTQSEAQEVVADLLEITTIIDDMLLAIGRELRAHFGSGIDLQYFTDQLRQSLEGNATYIVGEAAQADDCEF